MVHRPGDFSLAVRAAPPAHPLEQFHRPSRERGGSQASAAPGGQVLQQQVGRGGEDLAWRRSARIERKINARIGAVSRDQFEHQPGSATPALRRSARPELGPVDHRGLQQVVDIGQQQRPAIEPVAVNRVDDQMRQRIVRRKVADAVSIAHRAAPQRRFFVQRGGVIEPPIGLPQPVV